MTSTLISSLINMRSIARVYEEAEVRAQIVWHVDSNILGDSEKRANID
jgi:hypothetical protein